MEFLDNLSSGHGFIALVLAYAYTFHWVRSGALVGQREMYIETLKEVKEDGLGKMILVVIFGEASYIIITFFFSIMPFMLLILAFGILGSIVNWLGSLKL